MGGAKKWRVWFTCDFEFDEKVGFVGFYCRILLSNFIVEGRGIDKSE